MRIVSGRILLPEDAPESDAADVLIEVRDVSLADAPSVVVAQERLDRVPIGPGEVIEFSLQVPEVDPRRRLSLRVHVDVDGSGRVSTGDLLTTSSNPVPATGTPEPLNILVSAI
jgi:putative lipoprotein